MSGFKRLIQDVYSDVTGQCTAPRNRSHGRIIADTGFLLTLLNYLMPDIPTFY